MGKNLASVPDYWRHAREPRGPNRPAQPEVYTKEGDKEVPPPPSRQRRKRGKGSAKGKGAFLDGLKKAIQEGVEEYHDAPELYRSEVKPLRLVSSPDRESLPISKEPIPKGKARKVRNLTAYSREMGRRMLIQIAKREAVEVERLRLQEQAKKREEETEYLPTVFYGDPDEELARIAREDK